MAIFHVVHLLDYRGLPQDLTAIFHVVHLLDYRGLPASSWVGPLSAPGDVSSMESHLCGISLLVLLDIEYVRCDHDSDLVGLHRNLDELFNLHRRFASNLHDDFFRHPWRQMPCELVCIPDQLSSGVADLDILTRVR